MFQIILLVVFGALAIAGILIFALAVGGNSGSSVGPIKIWGTLDQGAFVTVIRQAAESNPALSQVSYEEKDEATYESDLTNALASGTGPDLFLLRQDYAMKDAGKVAIIPFSALSRSQFENTFIEAASPFIGQSGVLGIPISADPLVLYWNKDMLASAGFSEPPKYWDQLFGMAQKISKKNDAGGIVKSAVAFGEYQNISSAKDILATLILQAGGAITIRDSTGRLVPSLVPKTAGASQATESALRFYTEFADPSKDDYSWNRSLPDAQKSFGAGDVALYVGYASEEPLIARSNPNLNFAIAPLPQIRSSPTALGATRVYTLAASKAGKNPAASAQVSFILGASPVAKALSTALGMPAARLDVLKASLPNPESLAFTDLGVNPGESEIITVSVINAHSWVDPNPEATADIFRGMIEGVTSGSQLVAQAVARADQQLGQLLGL